MRARQWRQWFVAAGLALVCLWLLSLIWSLAGKAEIAVQQATQAKAAYQQLEARKAELTADLTAAATPRGQEAAIRTAFGVAKPGEEVIVVVPPAAPTTTPARSWWQWFLSWF